MKRLILTGILVLATGFSGLMAQKKKKGDDNAQQAAQQTPGPHVKSQAEAEAVQALGKAEDAQDQDAIIAASESLLAKFADTEFKDLALLLEAKAYQAKGDSAKAQIFAERSLEANPKNYQTTMMLGELLAAHTGEHDFDRDEKLKNAEKYLNDAITAAGTAPKPNPVVSDAAWDAAKKQIIAEGHNGLGMVALDRKDYDGAIKEFQTAYSGDPQPAYQVRMASAQISAGKFDDAIAICEKLMAEQQFLPRYAR